MLIKEANKIIQTLGLKYTLNQTLAKKNGAQNIQNTMGE